MIEIRDNKLIINLGYVKFTLLIDVNLKLIEKQGRMDCPHRSCNGEMYPHHISAVHTAMQGYAVDIAFKCYKCDCYDIHGIAVDKETYQKALRLSGKWVVFDEKFEVAERLKRLGYW